MVVAVLMLIALGCVSLVYCCVKNYISAYRSLSQRLSARSMLCFLVFIAIAVCVAQKPGSSARRTSVGDYDACDVNFEDEEDYVYDDEAIAPPSAIRIGSFSFDTNSFSMNVLYQNMPDMENWEVWLKLYQELGGPEIFSKRISALNGTTNSYVNVSSNEFPSNSFPVQGFLDVVAIKDSDHDGLSDEEESLWGTNPFSADSDNDGLSDFFETQRKWDPTDDDMDCDGISDGAEYIDGSNPERNEDIVGVVPGIHYDLIGEFVVTNLVYDAASKGEAYENFIFDNDAAEQLSQLNICDDLIGFEFPEIISSPFMKLMGGVVFRPHVTGYYSFQIEADDYAWLKVGECKAEASWPTGAGRVSIGYFEANVGYAVTVFYRNNGGPTYLNCLKFAELVECPFIITNTIDHNVILYEDEYTNEVGGKTISKNSTKLKSTVKVDSGTRGGTLQVEVENIGKLKLIAGDQINAMSLDMPPNTRISIVGVYEGNDPSAVENDIMIRTVFNPEHSDEFITNEVFATAVQVETRAQMCLSSDTNRHQFGPLETVTLYSMPCEVDWNGVTADLGEKHSDGSQDYAVNTVFKTGQMCEIRLLRDPGKTNVFVSIGDATLTLQYTVIMPKMRIGREPQIGTEANWNDVLPSQYSGPIELYCGYTIETRLMPTSVDFSHIRVAEGVCELEVPEGTLSGLGRHTSGVWNAHDVDFNNCAGRDFVGKHNLRPIDGDWCGKGDWNIPVYWQPVTDPSNVWTRAPFCHNRQRFRCTSDGILSIQKMGCLGWRDTFGRQGVKTNNR